MDGVSHGGDMATVAEEVATVFGTISARRGVLIAGALVNAVETVEGLVEGAG